MPPKKLEAVLAAGVAPSFSSVAGFEFRGWNVFGDVMSKGVGTVMGIQRFAKGFFVRGGTVAIGGTADVDALPFIEGYNVKIKRGGRDDPWAGIPNDEHPTRHGYYRVFQPESDGVKQPGRKGRHPQALYLDYSLGDPKPGLLDGGGLRDFVVQVSPANPDLLLGKAYMTIGPIESVAGFFVVERLRPADPTRNPT